jgi:phosphoribosyl-ATP pyrophosphohydrolase/phosphoribosyl-AMP cyclohydrolase
MTNPFNAAQINWNKMNHCVPAIIQDSRTGQVLMLGYMNQEALERSIHSKKVCFFSRSKNRLWTKGETSGHFLNVVSIATDCDQDTILVQAIPEGPTCHLGTNSCFGDVPRPNSLDFLNILESIIDERKNQNPDHSYTAGLFYQGREKIAQKVGEEAVEVVIASLGQDHNHMIDESADLLFHFMILLNERGLCLGNVVERLKFRHSEK